MRALPATAVLGLVAVPPMVSAGLPSEREDQLLTPEAGEEASGTRRDPEAGLAPRCGDASDAELTCGPRAD
jgi:hypothetical protein